MRFIDKEFLTAAMLEEAETIVRYYFTDITEYDIPRIEKAENGDIFIWQLRESGSWLSRLDNVAWNDSIFNQYEENEVETFIIEINFDSESMPHTMRHLTKAEAKKLKKRYSLLNEVMRP